MKNFFVLLGFISGLPLWAQEPAADKFSASTAGQDIITASVRAYNDKDIKAYVVCFSPEVEVYNASGVLMYKGSDKLRVHFESFFKNNPAAKREVRERINSGGKVIEREQLTGIQGSVALSVTSIYELENGLIKAFYFVAEF